MRSRGALASLLALGLLPAALASAAPSYKVKYRSAANVYLDAGRAQGLDVGRRLRVVEGPKTIAELEVVFVAERSASCRVLSETRPVRAGDVAIPVAGGPATAAPPAEGKPPSTTPAGEPPAAAAPPPAAYSASAGGPSPAAPWARLRGSASIGYYRSWDQTDSGLDFEQRTARLDLGLYDIAGRPLSFSLRLRSRQDLRARTLSLRTPQDERTDQLYEAALRYEPPSDRLGFEVGRVGISRFFVGVGYLDGGLVRCRFRNNLQVGAFGGRVAEIDSLSLSGTGSRYGAFLRFAPSGRYAIGDYDALLAFVRENANGDVSREYLSLESRLSRGRRLVIFQRAELDLNRGWRQEVTGRSYQLSNLSLSANLRLSDSASAFASYDGRRNYRYFQNRVVPEEVFDDLLHQGLRAGLNYAKSGGFGASAGFGMSLKEPDPRHPELAVANAYSFNASLRHANLLSYGFSVGLDVSGFSNGYTDGSLVSARVGRRFGAGHLLDLSYGRSAYHVKQTEQDRTTQWLRLLGRAELGHRVSLQGNLEYDTGDDLKGPRAFLELGYLF